MFSPGLVEDYSIKEAGDGQEETSPLVHWLQITGRYEVVIQAGYVARSIGSVFFRIRAQFPSK